MKVRCRHPHPGPPHKAEGKEGVAPSQGFPSAGLRPDPPLRSGWSGSGDRQNDPLLVMPGLVPGIHVLPQVEGVDGRDKPGHDVVGLTLSVIPGERSEGRESRAE